MKILGQTELLSPIISTGNIFWTLWITTLDGFELMILDLSCSNFALMYLLESGEYDVNARGAKSRSPLQWATLKGASVSARYLLMHGADPGTK